MFQGETTRQKMSRVIYTQIRIVNTLYYARPNCRYFCEHHPKDSISPPGRLWRYITDKFTSFVDSYEAKLQKKSPKTYDIYRTIKCVRYIIADTHSYAVVSKDLWMGRELHTFTRKELEIYLEMPRHFKKIGPLLILAAIPFVGNLFFAVAYFFPRQMLTHHFWTEKQKIEFMQYFHRQKVNHFPTVLEHMNKQIARHTYGTQKTNFLNIVKKLEHDQHPSVEEILDVRASFNKFPFSVEDLPTVYYRLLAKVFDMTKRQSGLLQDALVLLHTDIAMVREGFDQMTSWELEKACYNRGLNPTGLSQGEQIKYLKAWTSITTTLDETSLSLLLHCPILLAYNQSTNTRLVRDSRFKWRRKHP